MVPIPHVRHDGNPTWEFGPDIRATCEVRCSDLVTDGFLERQDGYRYVPKSSDLRKAVEDLADTYGKRRVTVIGLIFAKPSDAVQSFADAFKLKED